MPHPYKFDSNIQTKIQLKKFSKCWVVCKAKACHDEGARGGCCGANVVCNVLGEGDGWWLMARCSFMHD